MKKSLSVLCLVSSTTWAASAPVGYATATSYYDSEARPAMFQPLLAVDGRPGTAWCLDTDSALDQKLVVGFKGVATIDEIRVKNGYSASAQTFAEYGRFKQLSVRGASGGVTVTVASTAGAQPVAFNPPIETSEVTLHVLAIDSSGAKVPAVCLSDLTFYSGGKALNGVWLAPKSKFSPTRAKYLGSWFDGPQGAATHFLSFFMDDTFRLVIQPHEGDKTLASRTITGTFRAGPTRVLLTLPGKKTAAGTFKDSNAIRTIDLKSREEPQALTRTFRDVF